MPLQLGIEKTNSIGKADVSVVEVADAAESQDGQQQHRRLSYLWQHLPMDVVLSHS